MSRAPYHADQKIEVEDKFDAQIQPVDYGTITVEENWGRLFITKNGVQIVVSQNAYRGLRDAIAHFIEPEPPCGECHLQAGEVCDICGRKSLT